MTNDELNQYIRHYIEKDRTGRAIMLSGPWGVGKSFYIKNSLIPFLNKPENGEHSCIVVSLYGISELPEISKAIYLETRAKRIRFESEKGKAAYCTAKTVIKGIASHYGVDLSIDEKDLQELFQSIDLTGKLIIFEDVERASINIFEFLGYVNSLVEKDDVKVLLVTNEEELLRYKPVAESNPEKRNAANFFEESEQNQVREYTEDTLHYLVTKEKSVGDTISFTGDLFLAVRQIIQMFNGRIMNRFDTDDCACDIVDIMTLRHSYNLRSIIFACQKTSDIYESFLEEDTYSDDFIKTIFYGIVFYSLQLHTGSKAKWVGLELYSMELGSNIYPLFRFCFDYITEQHLNTSHFSEAEEALKKMRFYDRNKTSADPDLQVLSGYHIHTEEEVKKAVTNITHRLANPEDISFYDYGRIAAALVCVKYALDIEIKEAETLLVRNLKGKGNSIHADDIFWSMLWGNTKEEQEEYVRIRDEMIHSLGEKDTIVPEFNYLPQQTENLYNYVIKNEGSFYESKGFAKYLDIPKFIDMFFRCSPAQMDCARRTFVSLYRPGNIKNYFTDDLSAIKELRKSIEIKQNNSSIDRVQIMQCQWFVENLTEIENKLL